MFGSVTTDSAPAPAPAPVRDVDVVSSAFHQSYTPDGSGRPVDYKKIWQAYFSGWSDSRLIDAILAWGNGIEDDRTMVFSCGSPLFTVMPEMVKDASALHASLRGESDPRKFLVASTFADSFTTRCKEDFIPDRFHMLFKHGRVARNISDYPLPLFDVSVFTYSVIVRNLKTLGSDFDERNGVPYDGNVPYPEKVPLLAKWLKENWPGCGNLEIPEGNVSKIDSASGAPVVGKSPQHVTTQRPANIPSSAAPKRMWPFVACALLLAGICALFFSFGKFKRRS